MTRGSEAHPPIPWPGFSARGTLLLPLDPDRMATPFGATFEHGGLRLRRKREFHVTVLDATRARAARARLGAGSIRALYAQFPWTPQRTGRYALLRERKCVATRAVDCWSLIEHLELPAMAEFLAALARRLDTTFGEPVPHVTHYVAGDADGIGVPHVAALTRMRVCDLVPPRGSAAAA